MKDTNQKVSEKMYMLSDDQLYSAIGKLVRSQREQAKLTQDELAQRVGLTRTSITHIENGRQKVQVHTLYAIADALHTPISVLLPDEVSLSPETVQEQLPQDLAPAEREWVERVLRSRTG